MKLKAILAIAAIFLTIQASAQARFLDGNRLLSELESPYDNMRLIATAYLMGVVDAQSGVAFCPPDGFTQQQLRDVVTAFLRENPVHRHLKGGLLVVGALYKAYPCPTQK